MNRRTWKRLAWATLTLLVLLGLAEVWLRRLVPSCGVTPFRLSEVQGLSSEFRPGFATLYKGFEVSFNSHGFRGGELPARQDGVLRVALVGDSIAFGSAIDLPDTIAVRLEAALAQRGVRAQVLNLGVPGYAAANVAAVVEHKALALEPDVVIYVFYSNDTEVPVVHKRFPPDAVIDGMYGYPAHSALLQWLNLKVKQLALRSFGIQLARRTPEKSRAEWRDGGGSRVRAAVQHMRDSCAAAGARYLVASYPHLTLPEKNPFRPIDERAGEVCDELDVAFVDLLEVFGQERDLMRYWASVFDAHPSGAANAKVAAQLAAKLLE